MQKILTGISLLLLASHSCRATEVIAIRTKTSVVIGTDSKIVNGRNSFTGKKIFEIGGVVFGAANVLTDKDLNVDYTQLVRDALHDTRIPIATRLTRMEDVLQRNLTTTLSHMRNYRSYYEKYRTIPLLEVLVVGFDGAIPHVYIRKFHTEEITITPSVTIERHDCPRDCEAGPTLFAIGSTTNLKEFIASHPGNYKTTDQALNGVCGTIKGEMNATPQWLGPPIQMVIVDSKGIHWQRPRDENCREQ